MPKRKSDQDETWGRKRQFLGRIANRSKVKTVQLLSLGKLVFKQGWSNAGYIFPKDFEALIQYKFIADPSRKVPYRCQIRERGGKPWFVITCDELSESFEGKSPTACWKQILDRINLTLQELNQPLVRTQVAGPEYFGLNDPRIVEMIEELDPKKQCTEYWTEKEKILEDGVTKERPKKQSKKAKRLAKERADLIFATLSVMDYVQHGARRSDDKKPPYFRFDDAAQELFYEWLIRLETVKLRGNEEGLLLEHLTKYRKLMPALALIFHLVSVADGTASGAVSAESTRLAIAWCDYLETHARRIYHMATDVTQQAAKALSRRIRKKEIEDSFTIRSLYRKGWQGLDDQELAEAACDELVRLGWLKEMHQPASPAGGRSKTSYRINPKLRHADAG